MSIQKTIFYHLSALVAVIIWGVSFISSKALIDSGLNIFLILFLRFLLSYLVICPFSPYRLFCKNLRDELLCLAAGVFGVSLCYVFESMALKITQASNVSFIVSISPIFTLLITYIICKKKKNNCALLGALIAILGQGNRTKILILVSDY